MIGEKLTQLRLERKLKIKDVAEAVGIDPSTYGKYEKGQRKPGYQILLELADFYGVTTDFLTRNTSTTPLTQEHLTNTYSQIAEDLGEDVQVMFHDITSFDDKEREELKNFIEFIKSKKK